MSARPLLLIDPDLDWCARVCRFLEPHGIAVVAVQDVTAAVGAMEQFGKPSTLVMDIAARRENGRAMATLRTGPALRDVPVAYVKKSAALDALLLMVTSSATVATDRAA